jgi:antitoxin component YwqK of YwqJK toxin-antitoxin module
MKIILTLAASLSLVGATFAQSDTVLNQVDKKGLMQGYWQKKYPNGQLAYRAFFVDDNPRGLLVRYHENGARMAVVDYFDDGKKAFAQLFAPTGKRLAEGYYVGISKRDGAWKIYGKNDSLLKVERYENGLLNGLSTLYYPSGAVCVRHHFKDGKLHGLYEQLDEQGNLSFELMFANGVQHGGARYYYTSNQTRIAGHYDNGLRSGEWTFYKPNGSVERRTTFTNGVAADQAEIDKKNSDLIKEMEAHKGEFQEPNDRLTEE